MVSVVPPVGTITELARDLLSTISLCALGEAAQSRLERIAKDHAKQQKIEFAFEKTDRSVSVEKRGTNVVATICFCSGMGKPFLEVEVAPAGQVITNHMGIAICGIGRNP